MPERRICSFSGEEIEPGTGMMFVRRDGSIMWFKNSKARKNMVKLGRNSRRSSGPAISLKAAFSKSVVLASASLIKG